MFKRFRLFVRKAYFDWIGNVIRNVYYKKRFEAESNKSFPANKFLDNRFFSVQFCRANGDFYPQIRKIKLGAK